MNNTGKQLCNSLPYWYLILRVFNPLTPGKLRKNGTFKQQMAFFWPCLIQFCPNPHEKCFLAWTVAVSFGLRTFSSILSSGHAHNSKFWGSFFMRKTPPSTALRDLAHVKPVAFVPISVFAFCCRVSQTTMVFGDEKSLASKLVWKGKSWPKVAVGGKAMIFLCFWGKSSVVFWLLFRFTWSDHRCSGIIYKIFLRCIDWLSEVLSVT